jgi:hypothetical protein
MDPLRPLHIAIGSNGRAGVKLFWIVDATRGGPETVFEVEIAVQTVVRSDTPGNQTTIDSAKISRQAKATVTTIIRIFSHANLLLVDISVPDLP